MEFLNKNVKFFFWVVSLARTVPKPLKSFKPSCADCEVG